MSNKSSRRLLRTLWLFLGVLQVFTVICALERPAQAYVDPGSGYVLLQVIGSMCAGALFYFRQRWRRLFGLGVSEAVSGNPSSETEE
jgi:hypothetical protein